MAFRAKTRYELNWRLLAISLAAAAVCGGALYLWHSHQVTQIAAAMLARAGELENSDRYPEAAGYLLRYVSLQPQDPQGRIRLATAYDHAAGSTSEKYRAAQYYYQAVGVATVAQARDLRQRLAELLLETGRAADAQREAGSVLLDPKPYDAASLRKLLSESPVTDARALRTMALARYLAAAGQTAPDWSYVKLLLTKALELNAVDVELTTCLADVQRSRLTPAQPDEADAAFDRFVTASDESADALLARYNYRQRYGDLAGAAEDLRKAGEKAPRAPNVVLAIAQDAARQKDWDRATEAYRLLIELLPREEASYLGLAAVLREKEDVDQAIALCKDGQKKLGQPSFRLEWLLCDLSLQQAQANTRDQHLVQEYREGIEHQLTHLTKVIQDQRGLVPSLQLVRMSRAADYLQAKYQLWQKKPFAAIQILERLAVMPEGVGVLQSDQDSSQQIQLLLAGALADIGQWDRAAAVYERIVAAEPSAIALRWAAAKASFAARDYDAAIRHLQPVLAKPAADARAWELYAQALYMQQLFHSADQRDWSGFQAALSRLHAGGDRSWQLLMLEADFNAQTGKDQAVTLIGQAESAAPDDPNCLRSVTLAYEMLGQPAEADRVLAHWTQTRPSDSDCILAQATILARRKEVDRAIDLLQSALENRPDEVELQLGLSNLLVSAKRVAEANDMLEKSELRAPGNLRRLEELDQLALVESDLPATEHWKQTEHWEQQIRDLEGPEGTIWRARRALRLLRQFSPSNDKQALAEAQRLAAELRSRRPAWPETYLVEGELAERQGNVVAALSAYRQAIGLGDRRLALVEKVVGLLYRTGQYDDARQQLQHLSGDSDGLSSMAVALSLQKADTARAVELANEWTKRHPDDANAFVWLGQAEHLAGDKPKAESALRHATELAPQDIGPWQALFSFLLQTGDHDSAREVLASIEGKVNLPAAQKSLVLAECLEALGDATQAIEQLQLATDRLDKTDKNYQQNLSAIQYRLAALMLRSKDPHLNEKLKQLQSSAKTPIERRQLAGLLAAKGDQDSLSRALEQLDKIASDSVEAARDDRMRAVLLIARGGERDRSRAIELLANLVDNPREVQPTDRLTLAQLYEADGKLPAARAQFQALAGAPKVAPPFLAAYAEFLLRHEHADDAEPWIRQLEQLAPQSFLARSVQARWLHAYGRTDEIESRVEPVVEAQLDKSSSDSDRSGLALSAGQLYTAVGLPEPAMKHYQQAMRWQPSAKPAIALAAALQNGTHSGQEFALAEPFVVDALQRYPNDIQLLLTLSGLRYLQGDLAGVVDLSRKVLAIDKDNAAALNNLSSLLAEQPEHRSEALELVQRAIDRHGRKPTLLDTQAMIFFHQGRFGEASELLEEATINPQGDGRIYFHYAIVCHRLGELSKAKEKFAAARAAGLQISSLTPLERNLLSELEPLLEAQAPQPKNRLTSTNSP